MKKLLAVLIGILLILSGCGLKETADDLVGQAEDLAKMAGEIVEAVENEMSAVTNLTDGEAKSPDSKAPSGSSSVAENSTFDGRKGQISIDQKQERFGIEITMDYLLFDDEHGTFDPPGEGMIFLYPVFTITNQSTAEADIYFASSGSCILDVDGTEYKREINALFCYGGEVPQLDIDVDYGETAQAMSGFIIPEDWKAITFSVTQMFDGMTNSVNLEFRIERESGNSPTVKILDPPETEELAALPRPPVDQFLSEEDAREVTGLHLIDIVDKSENVKFVSATFVLHEDPAADAKSDGVHKITLEIHYPSDALAAAESFGLSGSEHFEFSKGTMETYDGEMLEGIGDEAFRVMYGGRTYVNVLKDGFDVSIGVSDGDSDWLVPLGEKVLTFIDKNILPDSH